MYTLTIVRKGIVVGTSVASSIHRAKEEAAKMDGAGITLAWQNYGSHEGAHSTRDDEKSYLIHRAKVI